MASGWTVNSLCATISREWHLLVSSIFVGCVSFVCCSTMQQLVSALVLSRLEYCNAVLSGLPSTTLDPWRRVLNAAVRLIASLGPRDHVTEQMKKLHWLPIKYRINFKLCLMMHTAVTGQCPQYIRDIVHPLSTLSGRNRPRAHASSTSPGQELLSVKELFPWLVHASETLFHKTLQTSQTEKLLTLRTSAAGIPTLCKLPYGVRSQYTGGSEVNAQRQKSVYRRHGMSTPGTRSWYTDFAF